MASQESEPAALLPQVLLEHCQQDGIDPATYALPALEAACRPLHLRLRGSCSLAQVAVAAGAGSTVHPVQHLPHCAVVHAADTTVSKWELFRSGGVYPMNAASVAAVAALHLGPGQQALELCCAPGGKLIAMADAMHMQGGVTGVDLSADRLAVACRLLQRHGVVRRGVHQAGWRCRVLLGDATRITVPPRLPLDAVGFAAPDCTALTRLPTHNSSARGQKRARTPPSDTQARVGVPPYKVLIDSAVENRIKNKSLHGPLVQGNDTHAHADSSSSPPAHLFDAVLVDAECSHDGSLPHMLKLAKQHWQGLGITTLQKDRVAALPALQGALLRRGWAHLAPGGRLVYSTCSLGRAQNEGVIGAFLQSHPDALVVPAEWEQAHGEEGGAADAADSSGGGGRIGAPHILRPLAGGVQHTLRFDPLQSGAGGLFIACLVKAHSNTAGAVEPAA